jgi:alpha-D-xyloside xylohydrolase
LRSYSSLLILAFLATSHPGALTGAQTVANPLTTFKRQPDGIAVQFASGVLRLQILSPTVVRVAFSPLKDFVSRDSIDRIALPADPPPFTAAASPEALTLVTAKLRVSVNRKTGAVSFADADGRPVLAEAPGGRALEPADVQGEQAFHVRQQWLPQSGESLYGLGQMQLGIVDIKGYDLDLWQHNTNVVVPFLVSSKGYGILWDNTSYTRFGDLRPFTLIPADDLFDMKGKGGGLTVAPADGSAPSRQSAAIGFQPPEHPEQCGADSEIPGCGSPPREVWKGSILAPRSGDYQFRAYSNGGLKVWLDGKLVMNHWRQNWLPSNDEILVHLEAGRRYPIRIENDPEQQNTLQFEWKTPAPGHDTSLWSQVGDGIDYYFVYGPSIDQVIGGYRLLTGRATMLPDWVFGLWQSRQRYQTAQQSLNVVREFRQRAIPFDNIAQDWQYWPPDQWGSHQFDRARFPEPTSWIEAIHALHAHLMISVWGKFNPNTENGREMEAKGYLYKPNLKEGITDWIGEPYTFYDAFNPDARRLFWSQIERDLFSRGIDAWWMDATEPDLMPSPPTLGGQRTHMNPTYLGTGSRMLNGYALENSKAVYNGQREAAPNQRVFILTRSGFAGIQRYSTAIWSGDTTSTWTAMRKQIAAGLGTSMSGLPYWSMDTGGYTMQRKFGDEPMTPAHREEWRELNARWFEFATFTPILRVHGELRPREMWTLGKDSSAYHAELKFDRLRYALFPYIYSMAGWTTQRHYTMLRPLVMDFPSDATARELADEYMFGPAFLVAPVTHYKQRSRHVYLPGSAGWYNFWTGARADSGGTIAKVPYGEIPVFVRAGSIVPFGPAMQYTAQKPYDPITVYVYAGANGEFTLYEDQGTNFNYENGAFSEIPISWNDAASTLTIGARTGSFPGMLRTRTIRVVLISGRHPAGFAFSPDFQRSVTYNGSEIRVKL